MIGADQYGDVITEIALDEKRNVDEHKYAKDDHYDQPTDSVEAA